MIPFDAALITQQYVLSLGGIQWALMSSNSSIALCQSPVTSHDLIAAV